MVLLMMMMDIYIHMELAQTNSLNEKKSIYE